MPINVCWYEGADGEEVHGRSRYANCTWLNELFDALPLGDRFSRNKCVHWSRWERLPEDVDGAVVVLHGGNLYHADPEIARKVNEQVSRLQWCLFVVIGDEASEMPVDELYHPRSILWVQNPKPGRTVADRYMICGYPNDCRAIIDGFDSEVRRHRIPPIKRDLDWSFAGQMTHARRHRMGEAMSGVPGGLIVPTAGFGQGLPHRDYYKLLLRSRIVLCPSGPETPDSYRMAEALEAGCIPVLDACALDGVRGYWDLVFGEHPFPVVDDWADAPRVVTEVLVDYERVRRKCHYHWRKIKLDFRGWLEQDLRKLGAL